MSLIECVPNFSEGRRTEVIQAIAASIAQVKGIKLLNVDSGQSANRTVYTFCGEAEPVMEAAYAAAKVGLQLIDMKNHEGNHIRVGALDVCPIVPLINSDLLQCAQLATTLGRRLGEDFNIPIYMYGAAATDPARQELPFLRQGGYSKLAMRMQAGFRPDFGPNTFSAESGAAIIGARKVLIALNICLNSKDVAKAQQIAQIIRSSGYKIKLADGRTKQQAGRLANLRALGWYVEEYGCAQVSMNLTDYKRSSLFDVFKAVETEAAALGLAITGSELIGMLPADALIQAAHDFATLESIPLGQDKEELFSFAVNKLGLAKQRPFVFKERILDEALGLKIGDNQETKSEGGQSSTDMG